jgi:dienelactone hydrolase
VLQPVLAVRGHGERVFEEVMRKRWKLWVVALAGLVALVVVPVVARQLWPAKRRALEGVSLAETRYREVQFRNEQASLDLAGMLLVPGGEGPFPAVVIIHGSGTSRRDNAWYLTLCAYLQENGIVVLLPDKRGSEKSQGNWRTSGFEELAGDTVAAVEFLKQQQEVPISSIGILGMSQGGHIAPLVADRAGDLAFVVSVVGGTVPLREGLLYEENHNLRQIGLLPGISNFVALLSTTYLVRVGQKDFWNAIGHYDPLPYWEKLEVPALAMFGGDDTNVDTADNAARLRGLKKSNIGVEVYEGSGHALEDPQDRGNRIFREDALRRIRDFVRVATARG